MRHWAGIFVLTALSSSAVPGQTAGVPAKWIGTWTLNVAKSKFDRIPAPGLPGDLTIVSQTLRIEPTERGIELSGDTVISVGGKSYPSHDDNSLSFDGRETVVGPVSLSFRRIDDFTFEIVSKGNIRNRNLGEVSRFSFSSDGKTLTETKTQTEQELAPEGAVPKTTTSVLIFNKNAAK